MTIAYLNGKFLPLAEAHISPMDRGFLFGDGVYEVIPVYQGKAFRVAQHLQRFAYSMNAIFLSVPLRAQDWEQLISELIQLNGSGDQVIYLQCTRGAAPMRDQAIPVEIHPTVFAYSSPLLTKSFTELSAGVSAITVPDTRWQHCNIKAITLLPNILLRQQALMAGVQEAILIREGYAMESTAANLFVVRDGKIITPPLSNNILGGITRDLVLEIAEKFQQTYSEMNISETMLHNADEIWLTSASREITPVIQLDNKSVGNGRAGSVWKKMIGYYQEFKKL